jgi:hypothetical protein
MSKISKKAKGEDEFFSGTVDNRKKFIPGEIYRLYFKTEDKSILDVYGVFIKEGDVDRVKPRGKVTSVELIFKCISVFEKLTKKDPYSWDMIPGEEYYWYLSEIDHEDRFAKINC